jgi:sigma-E factor negative regulatory protein RseC
MIEEEAVVTRAEAGRVWVEKARQSACGSCAQPCATASVAEYLDKPSLSLVLDTVLDLRVGDRVVLGVGEDVIVKGSLAVYLLPLLGLLGGAILGKALGQALLPDAVDLSAALGGGVGLAAVFAFLKRARLLTRGALQPVVLRKAD